MLFWWIFGDLGQALTSSDSASDWVLSAIFIFRCREWALTVLT